MQINGLNGHALSRSIDLHRGVWSVNAKQVKVCAAAAGMRTVLMIDVRYS